MSADVTQYEGRTYDVMYLGGVLPSGEAKLLPALVTETSGGSIVTGIQKLIQNFVLELLTDLGSVPYQRNKGTNFLIEARLGVFRTQLDVSSAFSRAVSLIEQHFDATELDSDPDDEKFASATLRGITMDRGSVSLTVALASVAGEGREIILPIDIVV